MVYVVQLLRWAQLFVTPWIAARQASLFFSIVQSLLKLMAVESVMPSNHLILCLPLLLLPSSFPSIRVLSNELTFSIRWPKYWNFSFRSVLPVNIQLIIGRLFSCQILLVTSPCMSTFPSKDSAHVCFLDLSKVEYISLSNSLSAFSLFWGLSEKVWRSKPFTGNCFLVGAGVDAEGFYSSSLGSSLCFEREKWVAVSLGVWALLSICGFGIPFPRFFVLLQNAFCVKALPLD